MPDHVIVDAEDMLGYMVRAERFRDLVRASDATEETKRRVIEAGDGLERDGLIDSLRLGMAFGALSREIDQDDLSRAIAATRDLNQLPYVSVKGTPIS